MSKVENNNAAIENFMFYVTVHMIVLRSISATKSSKSKGILEIFIESYVDSKKIQTTYYYKY